MYYYVTDESKALAPAPSRADLTFPSTHARVTLGGMLCWLLLATTPTFFSRAPNDLASMELAHHRVNKQQMHA